MALHNFFSFGALNKFCLLAISPILCSAIHIFMLIKYGLRCFPLSHLPLIRSTNISFTKPSFLIIHSVNCNCLFLIVIISFLFVSNFSKNSSLLTYSSEFDRWSVLAKWLSQFPCLFTGSEPMSWEQSQLVEREKGQRCLNGSRLRSAVETNAS